jgi:hypothetical protein
MRDKSWVKVTSGVEEILWDNYAQCFGRLHWRNNRILIMVND